MSRPKGLAKTGDRKKGSINKRTKEIELRSQGQIPLDYMLHVMRDPKADPNRQDDMAKAAAPYVHARRAPEDKRGNTVPAMIYVHPDLEEPE
jgi:hypothetical protein